MTTLVRLVPVSPGVLDRELATIDLATISRTPNALQAELSADLEQVTSRLARAGFRVDPAHQVRIPAEHRPAIARHLDPIDGEDIYDIVLTRRVPLAKTTAALLRPRPLFRRASAADRDRCRALLHEMEAVIAWRRIVWCRPQDLGALSRRARVSPVVFDRAALDRSPTRWCDPSAGAIGRWATR
jgi:hypothetical protein